MTFHWPQLSGRVDHGEIPGRHHVFGLCVPGWRDVSMRSAENNDPGLPAIESAALRILARDVAVNRSVGACGSFEPNRNVSDTQRGRDRYQIDKRVFLHEIVEEPAVLNQLGFGNVKRFAGGFWCSSLCPRPNARQGESGEEMAAVHSRLLVGYS